MSWDKNTRNCSEVDTTIKLLKELKVKFKIKVLGKVIGQGLNDEIGEYGLGESKSYPMRRLEYQDNVVLEKIIRAPDCDVDDVIVSEKFSKGKEPKRWKIEISMEEE